MLKKGKVIHIDTKRGGKKKLASVSAVVIAKNEEKNIGRMLSSITNFVDEIILVDTGSTDKTNEIAEKYGAKIYYHKWENDFSKARNYAISHATKEWVFTIDCDEELVVNNAEDLKKTLGLMPKNIGAVTIELQDIRAGVKEVRLVTPRFFRNGAIQYNGIVHNNPVYDGDKAFYETAYLKHYGYDLNEAEKKAKINRTVNLLKKRLRDDSEDFSPLFYLSQSYGWLGNYKKSIKYAEKYVKQKENIPDYNFFKSVYYTLAMQNIAIKNYKQAERWVKEGLRGNTKDLDLLWAMTLVGVFTNNRQIIELGAHNFIGAYTHYNKAEHSGENSHFVFSYTPECYAFCLYQLATGVLLQGYGYLSVFAKLFPNLVSAEKNRMAKDLNGIIGKLSNIFDHLEKSETEVAEARNLN